MRNDLVEGAEIISSFGPLDSEKDYEQLYKQLEHIPGINMVRIFIKLRNASSAVSPFVK